MKRHRFNLLKTTHTYHATILAKQMLRHILTKVLNAVAWQEEWVLLFEHNSLASIHHGSRDETTKGVPLTILCLSTLNPHFLKE